jgi:hypothetical protein
MCKSYLAVAKYRLSPDPMRSSETAFLQLLKSGGVDE